MADGTNQSNITFKEGREVPQLNGPNAKKKHYWWRYLLFFFGGFFACIGVIVGSLAITGSLVKLKDLVKMAGQNPNEILGENYQNDSILTFVQKMSTHKFETLGDVNEVSPMIQKAVEEDLNPVLDENLHYTFKWEELKIKPFKVDPNSTRPATEYDKNESLMEYIPNAIKSGVALAAFIDPDHTATGILQYILYPDDGEGGYNVDDPYTIADFMQEGFFQNMIDNLKIGQIVPDINNSPFLAQMANWGISDFSDENIKTLTLGGLFTDEDKANNPLLAKISSWTINDFSDMENKINEFKICEIINTSTAEGLLKTIENKTIAELKDPDFINTLKLKDIMTDLTPSDGIMYTLAVTKDYTIGDLKSEDAIMSLKLNEVITDISGGLLNVYADKTLAELKNLSMDDVRIADIFTEEQINGNQILKGLLANNPDLTVAGLSDYENIKALKLSDILTDYAGNKVLESLVAKETTIASISTDINSLTLKDVVDIGTDENAIIYKIAMSDALKDTPIDEIGDHFAELTIGNILTVEPTSPQIIKTLQNIQLQNLDTFMNDLTAKDIMEIKVGDIYRNLDAVEPNDLYVRTEDGWEIVIPTEYANETENYWGNGADNPGFIAEGIAVCIEGHGVPTVSTVSTSNVRAALFGVRDAHINDATDLVNSLKMNLKLKDVVEINNDSPEVLKSLSSVKLSDIPDKLKTLKLSEVISIDAGSPQILLSLANVTVFGETENLKDALINLKFSDYFTEADCSSGILKALWDSTDPGGDFLLSDVASKINALKIVDVLEDEVYEKDSSDQYIYDPTHTYRKIKPSWWFLLTEEELSDYSDDEKYFVLRDGKDYTMNDMGKLVTNMEFHMKNETLFNLIDAEFIILDATVIAKLNQTIPLGVHAGKKYGDLTIKEFLETAATFMP